MKNQIKKPSLPPGVSRKGLQLDDFILSPYLISIQYQQKGLEENQALELCRSCFEQWLGDTGRLCWVSDTTGYDGHHQQHAGTMITDDYWEYTDYEQKTEDLKDFIIAEVKAQSELD
jgi:hypothetical protein